MENFTNTTLDTTQLPRFEEVQYSKLHPDYWKVVVINSIITFLVLGVAMGLLLYLNEDIENEWMYPAIVFPFVILVTLVLLRIGFKKKGFAFREHDVLFQKGIIATKTIVIPYNRVQHVSLHEGLVSRYYGLAKLEIFTAGGSSSDIEIPGLEKEQAENIKQLLMGKIRKQL